MARSTASRSPRSRSGSTEDLATSDPRTNNSHGHAPTLDRQVPAAISITATATAAARSQLGNIQSRGGVARTAPMVSTRTFTSPGSSGCRKSTGRSPSGTTK